MRCEHCGSSEDRGIWYELADAHYHENCWISALVGVDAVIEWTDEVEDVDDWDGLDRT